MGEVAHSFPFAKKLGFAAKWERRERQGEDTDFANMLPQVWAFVPFNCGISCFLAHPDERVYVAHAARYFSHGMPALSPEMRNLKAQVGGDGFLRGWVVFVFVCARVSVTFGT